MASRIQCRCGEHVLMNLFAGADVSLVLSEKLLESLDVESNAIAKIIHGADHLVRCRKCGRFILEERASGQLTFLTVDPH